jgi:hypothetical protein
MILAAIVLTGCAHQQPAMPAGNIPPPSSAAALAFDPPLAMYDAPIDLSRADRGEAAFAGYEDESISYYGIYSDNRQASDGSDQVVRDAFSIRIGTARR